MGEEQHHNGKNSMQSARHQNKKGRSEVATAVVHPFTFLDQTSESFLKSQRQHLVKCKDDIEGKISVLDNKIAKFTKSESPIGNTSMEAGSGTSENANSNTNSNNAQRPLSPPLHWSTQQVLNQFFKTLTPPPLMLCDMLVNHY